MQELQRLVERLEDEKREMHGTLVQTETLIKEARAEHASELQAARSDSEQALEHAQADVRELRVEVCTCV